MERKLGEVFQDEEITLKVELADVDLIIGCDGCFYDQGYSCLKDMDKQGSCTPNNREDNLSVIFAKQN